MHWMLRTMERNLQKGPWIHIYCFYYNKVIGYVSIVFITKTSLDMYLFFLLPNDLGYILHIYYFYFKRTFDAYLLLLLHKGPWICQVKSISV